MLPKSYKRTPEGAEAHKPSERSAVEERDTAALPCGYRLSQNYPNPFNPSTTIVYDLLKARHVCLGIYNIAGQRMATLVDGHLSTGEHTFTWNGSDAASGVYLYRLETDNFVDSKKMILLK